MTTDTTLKVLIVNESPTFRYDVMGMLSNLNYKFFQANSGLRAIQSALTNHPDIILMNMQLPDMTGIECLRRIKQNALTEKIRVIIMREMTREKDVDGITQEAYRLGCSDFVTIPIVPAALERRMEKLARFVHISNTARSAKDTMAEITLPRRIRI
ncbi:MAG: response regulator [Deltaproteobacteria bacterium]|nr:response regulator [Deltaproteobacteria bacterium]